MKLGMMRLDTARPGTVRRRLLDVALLVLVLLMVLATPVLAAAYYAPITIVSTSATSYTNLPVQFVAPNTYLAANGFMLASGLDTRVETIGGQVLPHLVADNKTLTATNVPATSNVNLRYTTGNSALSAFYTILGWGGTLAITDDPDIEMAASFTVNMKGYLDVTGGATDYLLYKAAAYQLGVFSAGAVSAQILPATTVYETVPLVADGAFVGIYDVNWRAQTFTPAATHVINSVSTYLALLVGAGGIGTMTASIRETAAGVPTGSDLTSGSIALPIGGAPPQTITFDYPVKLTAGTTYAIVLRSPTSTLADHAGWYSRNTNPYAGGQRADSVDSGVSWGGVGASDFVMDDVGGIGNVLTGITAGVRRVQNTISGGNIVLTVYDNADVVIATDSMALGAGSVPGNGNPYSVIAGNVMPYMEYFRLTTAVGGVSEKVYYQPNAIISGTTLPDRQATGGSENGTITWGANPAGVTATLGGMVSLAQTIPGVTSDRPTRDILPAVTVSDWFGEPDVSGALLTNPLRPLVTILSDTTTLTERQAWVWFGIIAVVFTLLLAAKSVRGHHIITGVATGAAVLGMVVLTIFPLWALVFMVFAILAGAVAERSPSL